MFIIPTIISVGYYIFHNRENKNIIEIDSSAIIVALITAFATLFGIIIVEIVGWRKTLDKMKRYEDMIGVDKNRVCLSKQHEDLKEAFTEQNAVIKNFLNDEMKSANSKITHLYDKMKSDENEANIKKAVLAADGKIIDESVSNIKHLVELYRDEAKANVELIAENEKLKEKIVTLVNEEIARLKKEISMLLSQIDKGRSICNHDPLLENELVISKDDSEQLEDGILEQ